MASWYIEPGAVRSDFRAAAEALVAVTERLPPDAWDEPGLGEWSVRDLVGHASRALSTVEIYLDAADRQPVPPRHPLEYYAAIAATGRAGRAAVVKRGRTAGRELGTEPALAVSTLADRVLARVDREPDDAPVATPAGTMRLVDYLPSRIFELTVHRLDIMAATGGDVDQAESAAGAGAGVALSLVVAGGLASYRRDAASALLALTGRRALPAGFNVV